MQVVPESIQGTQLRRSKRCKCKGSSTLLRIVVIYYHTSCSKQGCRRCAARQRTCCRRPRGRHASLKFEICMGMWTMCLQQAMLAALGYPAEYLPPGAAGAATGGPGKRKAGGGAPMSGAAAERRQKGVDALATREIELDVIKAARIELETVRTHACEVRWDASRGVTALAMREADLKANLAAHDSHWAWHVGPMSTANFQLHKSRSLFLACRCG